MMRGAGVIATAFFASGAALTQSAESKAPDSPPLLRVCCRPLPRWSGSRDPLFKGLNRMIVRHLDHCFIDFPAQASVPGVAASVQTSGIHPIDPGNENKQPILSHATDNLERGGSCKAVKDATPEKLQRLEEELAANTCNSCGKDYHNGTFSGCYNNSNTYAYELIRGAGMTPPKMRGAPGYHRHRKCRPWWRPW